MSDEPEPSPTDKVWVTVYYVTREYGGPEEGGWYYDAYQPEIVIPTERQYGEVVKEGLEAREEYSNAGRPPLYSVRSTGRFSVFIEDNPAASQTRGRPQYS